MPSISDQKKGSQVNNWKWMARAVGDPVKTGATKVDLGQVKRKVIILMLYDQRRLLRNPTESNKLPYLKYAWLRGSTRIQ